LSEFNFDDVLEKAEALSESDQKSVASLRKIAGLYQSLIAEMLRTGKTKNQDKYVSSLSSLQSIIDRLEHRIEKAQLPDESRPIIFWDEKLTDDFLQKYLGLCPIDFPE
jgi:hypothetical protein